MNCSSVGHTAGVKLLIRAGAKVDVMDEVNWVACASTLPLLKSSESRHVSNPASDESDRL